jgi:hypothetical protein
MDVTLFGDYLPLFVFLIFQFIAEIKFKKSFFNKIFHVLLVIFFMFFLCCMTIACNGWGFVLLFLGKSRVCLGNAYIKLIIFCDQQAGLKIRFKNPHFG